MGETSQSAPQDFRVHSIVRNVRTRTKRASAPIHYRRQQFILDTQQRLLPGRPLALSEDDLIRNLDHLRELESLGIAEVRHADGRLIDLSTVTAEEVPVPVPMLKQPPMDAKHDPAPGTTYFPKMPVNEGDVVYSTESSYSRGTNLEDTSSEVQVQPLPPGHINAPDDPPPVEMAGADWAAENNETAVVTPDEEESEEAVVQSTTKKGRKGKR